MVLPITSCRTGPSIRVYPWKDDLETIILPMLQHGSDELKTVYVLFEEEEPSNENDNDDANNINNKKLDYDALALFDMIANGLPKLESVIIKLESSSTTNSVEKQQQQQQQPVKKSQSSSWFFRSPTPPPPPTPVAIPPVPALTSLLRGENRMKYLTLIGLPLLGDDYDMNGLTEAMRIHRGLHSFVMKHCIFETTRHLTLLKTAVKERTITVMKHCDLLDNYERSKEEETTTTMETKSSSSSSSARSYIRYVVLAVATAAILGTISLGAMVSSGLIMVDDYPIHDIQAKLSSYLPALLKENVVEQKQQKVKGGGLGNLLLKKKKMGRK